MTVHKTIKKVKLSRVLLYVQNAIYLLREIAIFNVFKL